MKIRYIVTLLLAGVLAIGLAGCYGSTASLNPNIEFTFPEDSTLPYMNAGQSIIIKGKVTAGGTNDSIKSYSWKAIASDDTMTGHFTVDDGPETIWTAPDWKGPDNLPVTLVFSVETLLGGHTKKEVHLLIVPQP